MRVLSTLTLLLALAVNTTHMASAQEDHLVQAVLLIETEQFEDAYALITPLAAKGDARAQYLEGEFARLALPPFTEPDLCLAFVRHHQAARQHYVKSVDLLSWFYMGGIGVIREQLVSIFLMVEAIDYYRHFIESGSRNLVLDSSDLALSNLERLSRASKRLKSLLRSEYQKEIDQQFGTRSGTEFSENSGLGFLNPEFFKRDGHCPPHILELDPEGESARLAATLRLWQTEETDLVPLFPMKAEQ